MRTVIFIEMATYLLKYLQMEHSAGINMANPGARTISLQGCAQTVLNFGAVTTIFIVTTTNQHV